MNQKAMLKLQCNVIRSNVTKCIALHHIIKYCVCSEMPGSEMNRR